MFNTMSPSSRSVFYFAAGTKFNLGATEEIDRLSATCTTAAFKVLFTDTITCIFFKSNEFDFLLLIQTSWSDVFIGADTSSYLHHTTSKQFPLFQEKISLLK